MVPPAWAAASRGVPAFRSVVLALWLALVLPAVAKAEQPLVCTPVRLEFGKVEVGQQKILPAKLSNTGSSAIKVASLAVDNQAFGVSGISLPLVLKAGQSVAFNVTFAPPSTRYAEGALVWKRTNGSLTVVPMYGDGVQSWSLSASPSSLAFGNVAVGGSSTLGVSLTNQGSSTITISEQEHPREFSVSGPTFPISLPSGKSVTFQLTFTPKWRGPLEGNFSLTSENDPVFTVPLSGAGTTTGARLAVAPATLSFGSVTLGNTNTLAGSIKASGGSVTISGASLGSSMFSLQGITLPLTLDAGQSASFDVIFAPQTGGTVTSALDFTSNAVNSPSAEALSGTGVASVYTVDLSWNPSTSQVSGYNIYRSSSLTGTYSKVNTSLDPATTFPDSTVASGATYYYDVTSVSPSGVESSPCTPVKITVN
jgi:hypothetical protein